jgi:hypothetical protein
MWPWNGSGNISTRRRRTTTPELAGEAETAAVAMTAFWLVAPAALTTTKMDE